jgi:hypothetical protein
MSVFAIDSPRRLFRDLCRAHRLPYRSRRLLRRLAAARGIAEPARLFVDASCFDTANLPEKLTPAADDVRLLRHRLFE